eukprot:6842736-Prymnesium_polylepis.1
MGATVRVCYGDGAVRVASLLDQHAVRQVCRRHSEIGRVIEDGSVQRVPSVERAAFVYAAPH